MKKLYLIGGTMGVGKTTVCRLLKKKCKNSVFLDGDWCWDAEPFQVTNETKRMVVDNICHLLNNFIHCSTYETVIFCWVMHEQSIIDSIVEKLDIANCDLNCISLLCNEKSLIERLRKDIESGIRTADILERSVGRIPFYHNLKTLKIDTDDKTPEEIADLIGAL